MSTHILPFIKYLWVGIFIVWAISGFATKRTVQSRSLGKAGVAVWIVWLGWWIMLDEQLVWPGWRFVPEGPVSIYSGLALTVMGLAFAVWARFTIGRNWSGMVTVTENHKLTRTGPYGIVRHPIYSGFMLATLGTAIAYGEVRGLVSVACVTLAWGYKSRVEESLMVEQFGGEYEQYRREVKALIPLVW